jgi:hypothetical protein
MILNAGNSSKTAIQSHAMAVRPENNPTAGHKISLMSNFIKTIVRQ